MVSFDVDMFSSLFFCRRVLRYRSHCHCGQRMVLGFGACCGITCSVVVARLCPVETVRHILRFTCDDDDSGAIY